MCFLKLNCRAASDITSAVSQLGWHPEPTLENKWPHIVVHERWHGTCKSCLRAVMLQSGLPEPSWDLGVPYTNIALAISQLAPILPWERDAAGNVLDT